MIIKACEFVSLKIPIRYKKKHKEQIFIKLKDNNGCPGYGEMAPLYKFSKETIKNTKKQLINIKKQMQQNGNSFKLHPSTRMGTELAVLQLLLKKNKLDIRRALGVDFVTELEISALIGRKDKAPETIKRIKNQKICTLKLKIGKKSIKKDICFIKKILKTNPEINLRIDSNKSLSLNDLEKLVIKIDINRIEHIEEPIENNEKFSMLPTKIKEKVALDEATRDPAFAGILKETKKATLVLKPTLIGGIGQYLRAKKIAKQERGNVILSSSFESNFLLSFFALINSSRKAIGADTYKWMKKNPINDLYIYSGNAIKVEKARKAFAGFCYENLNKKRASGE